MGLINLLVRADGQEQAVRPKQGGLPGRHGTLETRTSWNIIKHPKTSQKPEKKTNKQTKKSTPNIYFQFLIKASPLIKVSPVSSHISLFFF